MYKFFKNKIKNFFKQKNTYIVLFVVFSFFLIFYKIRTEFKVPLYGEYSGNSAHTITASRIWYDEGALNSKFASILSFKSKQYENLNSNINYRHIGGLTYPVIIDNVIREVYLSYPPGYLFPLFLVAKLFNERPSDQLLFYLNDFLSIILFIGLFLVSFKILKKNFNLISILTLCSALVSLGYLYFFQTFLSFNSLGVVYFILYIASYYYKKQSLALLFFIFGVFTDYLFFFVAIFHFAYRSVLLRRIDGFNILLIVTSAILFFLYIIQLHSLGLLESLIWKFNFRTGLTSETQINTDYVKDLSNLPIYKFIILYAWNCFKVLGPFIILIVPLIIWFIYKKKIKEQELEILFLSFIPPFLYTFAFRSSSVHEYETLKFIPFLIISLMFTVKLISNRAWLIPFFLILINYINYQYWHKKYIPKEYNNRHLTNLNIKNYSTNRDIIFELTKSETIWGKYNFKIAPYLWWQDYVYRERNIIRVEKISEIKNYIDTINVKPERYLLVINKTDLNKINNLKIKEDFNPLFTETYNINNEQLIINLVENLKLK
jgi:hypothetical protein